MKPLYACLLLSACATATHESGGDDVQTDASVRADSGIDLTDSNGSGIDSSTGCTVMTMNLLANPAFDGTPVGTGWNATPIDPMYPLIGGSDAGGIAPQSATYRAWMGGLERASASNKDSLYQDVAIPAMTTALELKGYYEVRTTEFIGGVYDTGTVELATQTNTRLELVQSLDNEGDTSAWTPFSKTFTGNYSGMTVRVRFSSAGDSTDATSFFFDTVELNATFCQ